MGGAIGVTGARLGLGTAQFGLDYGVTNRHGRLSDAEAGALLATALESGINLFDTAPAYGDAEARLGALLPPQAPVRIITKLPPLPPGIDHAGVRDFVVDAVDASRSRLRRDRLSGLLVHRMADLLGPLGDALWAAMLSLRQDGRVARIGASLYGADDLAGLLARSDPDLVQLPLNALDQRPWRGGWLAKLKARGVEVHARSLFLQGLLLADPAALPDGLAQLADPIRRLGDAARAGGWSSQQVALGVLDAAEGVDIGIVGATSAAELGEIVSAAGREVPAAFYAPFALEDDRLLNPSRWPSR